MGKQCYSSLLISTVLCLVTLPFVVGCGDDDSEFSVIPVPSFPLVTNFSTTSQAIAGEFTFVTQSVDVPGGISFAEDAFVLQYVPPFGEPIVTEFFATEINCTPGATFCSSSFQARVPSNLPVLPAEYRVNFSVIDQSGRIDAASQTVFITN